MRCGAAAAAAAVLRDVARRSTNLRACGRTGAHTQGLLATLRRTMSDVRQHGTYVEEKDKDSQKRGKKREREKERKIGIALSAHRFRNISPSLSSFTKLPRIVAPSTMQRRTFNLPFCTSSSSLPSFCSRRGVSAFLSCSPPVSLAVYRFPTWLRGVKAGTRHGPTCRNVLIYQCYPYKKLYLYSRQLSIWMTIEC